MSDPSSDPVATRVRNRLHWPDWTSWHDPTATEGPGEAAGAATTSASVETGPVDHESRASAVRRRLELATTVDAGGPYLDIFKTQAFERLERERGRQLGPLANFTFAIKDLIAVEGRRMGAGSAVRHDAPPEQATAPIVEMLEAQGAVAVGTVTLHEFAFGVTGINEFAGTAVNPKAPDRITGGSSSGSAAAVADGSARIAIGSDTGGSIRGPASFCGIVGFKPSFGCYPSTGVFPLSGTLDHVGLFATNVADIVAAHVALGHPVTATRLPARIGVARTEVEAADAEVQDLVETALELLRHAGCELVDVALPDAETSFATSTAIMFSEAAAVHAGSLAAHPDRYGADIKARLELGASLDPRAVATAHEFRRQLTAAVTSTLGRVDCIVGPTTPMVAPPVESGADPALPPRIVANTRLGNVVGLPAISVPLPSQSAPVGLHVLGATDADLLAHAGAVAAHIG